MSLQLMLKSVVEHIPYGLGSVFRYIPFNVRLGDEYTKFLNVQADMKNLGQEEKEKYVIFYFSKIFNYAKTHFSFYEDLYRKYEVYDLEITSMEDITKIPVIDKQMIRSHLHEFRGAFLLNTGGTSGEPFQFYVDKNAFAREWAHMHTIWFMKGYKPTDLKLTLRGKNLGTKPYRYNPVHNEYIINSYLKVADYKEILLKLCRKRTIRYLHGYPSAIYGFLKEIDECMSNDEKEDIRRNFKACFLSSEYPAPYMTDYIKQHWNLDWISWYGHSEMCILAYDELKNNQYKPFLSYGLAENVNGHLIGTSFHNFDMPLIRYDTGDLIASENKKGQLMEAFSITHGRNADYIIDKKGKAIPLTALIFGRHHKLFGMINYIQVSQKENGGLVTFIISTSCNYSKEELQQAMDLSNLDIDFDFQIVDKPVKTKAGKVKLKI